MSNTDLIVIGAGAAGTCAAMESAAAGLRTLLIEAFPEYGGAATTSGGGCLLVNTPLQAALGHQDSVELALADWIAWGGSSANVAWARLYIERSCQDLFDWLQEQGVEWVDLEAHEGNSVPRWHRPRGGGEQLIRTLNAAACHLPIEWRYGTPVTRLLLQGNAVVGVEVETGGQREAIRARAVVVATGGFANNAVMLREHLPDPGPGSRMLCGGARQATGKGHALLAGVGADFAHMDQVWIYPYGTPDYRDPTETRGLVVRGVTTDLWINAQGLRFHNEAFRGGWSGTRALMAQTPRTCWSVFDRAEANRLTVADPYYRSNGLPVRERIEAFLMESPYVHHADTVDGLAQAVGVPADLFAVTVQRFNWWLERGLEFDPDYGRDLRRLRPLDQPPYFAMQFFPLARKNLGGVRTDLEGRVLRRDHTAIPGLFAAGEVAGMAGGHINGRAGLEGTMLGPSIFSGRVAGRSATAAIRAGSGR